MNFKRHSFFTLGLLVIMLAAVIYALRWPLRTNILILLIGGTAVILLSVQLFKELFSMGSEEQSSGMDVVIDESQKGKEATKRILIFWCWLIGLFVGIWLFGFPVATTLFAFLYSILNGGRWYWSVIVAFLCFVFTYGLFEMVIHAPWPEPFLLQFITG